MEETDFSEHQCNGVVISDAYETEEINVVADAETLWQYLIFLFLLILSMFIHGT